MRQEMSAAQWEILKPLLAPKEQSTGRPRRDLYTIVSAIYYVLRTGIPWRDLPSSYGPWQTVYHYHNQWAKDGSLDHIRHALQAQLLESKQLCPSIMMIDSTCIRANKAAAGAQKKGKLNPSITTWAKV